MLIIRSVFALGDLLDLTKPALPTGGKKYYHLARAALTTEPIYSHPTLTVVQTIVSAEFLADYLTKYPDRCFWHYMCLYRTIRMQTRQYMFVSSYF